MTSDERPATAYFWYRMIYGFAALPVFFLVGAIVPGSRERKVAAGAVTFLALMIAYHYWQGRGARRR